MALFTIIYDYPYNYILRNSTTENVKQKTGIQQEKKSTKEN